jgi:hypothetical protein
MATAWAALGGKSTTGPPMTAGWTGGGRTYQVFQGVVLAAGGDRVAGALPIVTAVAAAAPEAYRQANQPPVTGSSSRQLSDDDIRRRLTDPAIARAYLGMSLPATAEAVSRARDLLGEPVGPATVMPDGQVRQAFAGAVLERPLNSAQVRMSSIGELALDAGIVVPAADALRPAPPPPSVWNEDREALPPTDAAATAGPFLVTLAAALALYASATVAVLLRGRRRRPGEKPEAAA